MQLNGVQKIYSNLFKRAPSCLYNALPKRSRRRICDPQTSKIEQKGTGAKKTCFDQVKALHDRDTVPVSHVIMDLDGVLLDSINYNTISHEEYLMKWKKALKLNTKYQIMGLRNIDAGKFLANEYEMPFSGEVYAHGVWQLQRVLYHHAKLVRGIDEIVCYFIKHKLPLALVSSTHKKAFNILYPRLKGLEKYFCHAIYGDEVVEGKPHPEIFIKAAKLFNGGPKDLSKYLVIDSSYNGALAAQAAGMQSIVYTDEYMPKEMQEAATIVLNNVRNFDPTAFHLPAIKK